MFAAQDPLEVTVQTSISPYMAQHRLKRIDNMKFVLASNEVDFCP